MAPGQEDDGFTTVPIRNRRGGGANNRGGPGRNQQSGTRADHGSDGGWANNHGGSSWNAQSGTRADHRSDGSWANNHGGSSWNAQSGTRADHRSDGGGTGYQRGRGRGRGGGSMGRGVDGVDASQVYSIGNAVPCPNTDVSKTENTIPESPTNDPLMRPSYGTGGEPVTLWANYVEMLAPRKLTLYRYHISIDPPEASWRKCEQIIRLWLGMAEMAEFKDDIVTDFRSNLISHKKLELSEYQFAYLAENENEPSPRATNYRVAIRSTGTFSVAQLIDFLTSTSLDAVYSEKLPIIQALNILVHHHAKSKPKDLAVIGSTKIFPVHSATNSSTLSPGIVALRGFFSSVRVATCRILINVNLSHGAFYASMPLIDLIQKRFPNPDKINYRHVQSFLRKLRVEVTHLNGRIKTISGLANEHDGHGLEHPPQVQHFAAKPKDVQFFLKKPNQSSDQSGGQTTQGHQGRYISVSDFFFQVHKKRLAMSKFPVVNLGSVQNPSYFPAEVCKVLPGQPFRFTLDRDQRKAMIDFSIRKPRQNAESIANEGLRAVGLVSPENTVLERFGISVTPNLITVAGRVLAPPTVTYKAGQLAGIRSGSWNMESLLFHRGSELKKWAVLTISDRFVHDALRQQVAHIVDQFRIALLKVGINAAPAGSRDVLVIRNDDDPGISAKIGLISKDYPLLLVVLMKDSPPLYKHIKHLGDVKFGIHTACVVWPKFRKDDQQYYANVALKMNLKLGGTNQVVVDRNGIIGEDKTMIVGIDVTHPSPGSVTNSPSVAALVANVDGLLGQWPATLGIQQSRQEMVADLGAMLKSRLSLWQVKHGKSYPDNILVYRDGVSEGQYASVLKDELPLLRTACTELYPADLTRRRIPRVTIVIVGKRHQTRFYPTDGKKAARNNANPKPGTVVDRGVTEARSWDFFMQAHDSIQGTARPAHYYVVLDEIFRNRFAQNAANELEKLTHQLCYSQGRATKAVSYCMPAYYAHLVCNRARCYLMRLYDPFAASETSSAPRKGEPGNPPDAQMADITVHPRLKDSMFYV